MTIDRLVSAIFACLICGVTALAQTPELAEPLTPEAPLAEVATETDLATPAESEPAAAAPAVVLDAPIAVPCETCEPAPACCPITIVDTRTRLAAKRAFRCGPAVNTVVCVKNAADCCLYSVPFCVPGCCVGEPQVCNLKVGLLGRAYADVVWPSGFSATVIFKVHGGAIVVYNG